MKLKQATVKLFSIITIISLMIASLRPVAAYDIPTPPPAPTPPPIPEYTDPISTPPPAPTPPPLPGSEPSPSPSSTPQVEEEDEDNDWSPSPSSNPSPSPNTSTSSTPLSSGSQTGGQTADGQSGDPAITTGTATNTAVASTTANTNLSTSPSTTTTDSGSGATIKNTNNGLSSTNSGSATINNTDNTIQTNDANVSSALIQDTTTGKNSTSSNVGDSQITTGDANTSGTLITAVNTNVDGVAVMEFNVVEDHVGDLILDFGSATCIVGSACGSSSPSTVVNSGNGSDSTNFGTIDTSNTSNTFQTNDATVANTMVLESNSGDNNANKNVGDSSITTGDANVSANSLTFANNNLDGDIIYAVVNIYGDLKGDIILPESMYASSATLANTGNGSDSTNTTNLSSNNTNNAFQTNDATITNNLLLDGTTGDNDVSKNTGGDSSITTGDVDLDAQVLNIANSNLIGGNWWLVIVNEAGRWIGRILDAPEGVNYAGSEGTEFTVNEFGEITAVNSGNGSGSTNTGTINQTTTNNTVQTNTANIVNNLDLSANTGGNSASKNTGGDSSIVTGDASIIANLVNFVNNNIVGGGRLYVTVVNVFGSWLGDFVGPGQHQQTQALAQGGVAATGSNDGSSSSSNSSGSSSSSSDSGNSGIVQAATAVLAQAGNASVQDSGFSLTKSQSQTQPEVQGAATNAKKVINVNLVWFIPLVLLWVTIRYRTKLAALLSRKI